jgi:AcrR family transcriptional regulator
MKDKKQNTDMRQNILTAASSLMMQKGVKETSLKDIALEVGISKGTLYYYYKAKEDIIYDIADSHLKKVSDDLLAWVDDINNHITPEQLFKAVFEQILAADTRGKLHIYLLGDSILTNSTLKIRFQQRYKEWKDQLEYGIKKVMSSRNIENEILAELTLAALDGFVIQRALGRENIPIEQVARLLSSIS